METVGFEITDAQDRGTDVVVLYKVYANLGDNVTHSAVGQEVFTTSDDRNTILSVLQNHADAFKNSIIVYSNDVPAAAKIRMEKSGTGNWSEVQRGS